jgi:hypothetical protein
MIAYHSDDESALHFICLVLNVDLATINGCFPATSINNA